MTYANPDALVSTDWLVDHLDDPDVRIIDVDEDITLYEENHIPGAIAWSWSEDLHHAVRRDYIDQEGFSSLLSSAAVGSATTVVLYGGNNNWFAAYAYWLLKYRGFDNVKLLDGGRTKWELQSLPSTSEVPSLEPTGFEISGAERPELRIFRDEVLESVGSATLIDVRSPEEFSGEKLAPDHLPQEQPYVGGHIPGARNIPWSKAANEDGTFKSAEELQELYGDSATAQGETTVYCRIGERSSHTWFVLNELLGHPNVKNYDGSWTEYGSLVDVPVEVGP
ncbi:MAG: sulfurtransferase [Acidobacteria bacterium]|nr:sulfurtransferase [Acidobacteriota bacterium]